MASGLGFFLEAHEIAHVVIVIGLTEVGAEVEPVFVDQLDTQVLEPEVPASGTDVAVNPFSNGIGERCCRQLPRLFAFHATRPLATKAGPWSFVFLFRGHGFGDWCAE